MTDIHVLEPGQAISEMMAAHTFLRNIERKYIDIFEECASESAFKQNDYLFKEKEKTDRLFLIVQGRVAIEIQALGGSPWMLMTAGAGEIVGWGWIFPPYCRQFSCRAVEDTVTIGLDTRYLMAKCEQDHELGFRLMASCANVLAERLWATRLQMLSLLVKDGR